MCILRKKANQPGTDVVEIKIVYMYKFNLKNNKPPTQQLNF